MQSVAGSERESLPQPRPLLRGDRTTLVWREAQERDSACLRELWCFEVMLSQGSWRIESQKAAVLAHAADCRLGYLQGQDMVVLPGCIGIVGGVY